jgi:hypothetical protein
MDSTDSPKRVVRELLKHPEMTQTRLVKELRAIGVKTSQPTISRIHDGHEKISFHLARGLSLLRERLSQPSA